MARLAVASLLKGLVRHLHFIFSAFVLLAMPPSAWGQVQPATKSGPGLNAGIVIGEDGRHSLDEGVKFQRTEGAPVDLADFSLTLVLELAKAYQGDHPLDFFWLDGGSQMLRVGVAHDGGGFVVRLGDLFWQAQVARPLAGRKVPITLSLKRDPRQALAGLWVDGVEQASILVRPGTFRLAAAPAGFGGGGALKGHISQIRLYDRALEREEILALAASALGPVQADIAPFGSKVEFAGNETIAVLGGTEAVAIMEDGTLEALLLSQAPRKQLKMRSLAWETDTVWRQDRPLNFGSLAQQLQRANATAVLLIFGRQECLERGEAGAGAFRQALDQVVGHCLAHTPRIILVAPPWFEAGVPPQPDLRPRNAALKLYQDAVLQVGAARKLPAVPPMSLTTETVRRTSDGLNLNADGIRQFSQAIASFVKPPPAGVAALEDPGLLAEIRTKNQFWHEYWRPSNWAFLYGDRTGQPSSRDHLNPQVRWFPAELEKYRDLIEAQEQQIWKQAAELERRVP